MSAIPQIFPQIIKIKQNSNLCFFPPKKYILSLLLSL